MITDLTQGNPSRILWRFSLPMLCSSIFQQLYNIADSVIAGRFVGEDALAAIGASYPVTMIFMAVAMGCNIGCSVVISQLFGAKRYGEMKTAVKTSFSAFTILSLLLTLLGFSICSPLMRLLNTPQSILADSETYLQIYIGGLAFLFLYNIATGVVTALGDSRTPLMFLIASSLGNIVLDILFVTAIPMGVAGVAWATFLAQGISSVLAVGTLLLRLRKIESEENSPLFSREMLGRISRIAIPSILQQSFISVGNLFVQALVNMFGPAAIAGYSAAVKLNTFSLTSLTTLANGVSSFTAQNIGAGSSQRVRQGFRAGIKMGIIVAVPITLLFVLAAPQMISIFIENVTEKALGTGCEFLQIVAPFYALISVKLIADGVLRGSGSMLYFMITTFSDLILRVILAFVFALGFSMGTTGIWISWPVGWAIAAILSVVFYRRGVWDPVKVRT